MSDALNSSSSDEHVPASDAGAPAPDATNTSPSSGDNGGGDTTGASPASTPVSDRDGLLAVIRDAVEPKEAKPSAETAPAADSDPKADPAVAPAPEPDLTDTELAGYKPAARKYIGKLTRERNAARDELKGLAPELAAHRQLTGYLQKHQLAADDVNALLSVGAALRRGDMQAFLDGIEPYRELALQSLGKSVSPDLQKQIEEGAITPEMASEMTRTRMAAARDRTELQVQRQAQSTRETEAQRGATVSAVTQWEQQVRGRDPDYALKEPLVLRAAQAILAEQGGARSPQDALQIVQRAYGEVTAALARTRPAPQPTRQTPAGISTPSLGAQAEPRSMREAIEQGLARAGAR